LAEPVVIAVEFRLDITVVPDSVALAIVALLVIVKEPEEMEPEDIAFAAVKLPVVIEPLTETFPKVVVAPLDVEVSANQAAAFASPSAGHTSIVLVDVLYQV
jgi:hypothetical protein